MPNKIDSPRRLRKWIIKEIKQIVIFTGNESVNWQMPRRNLMGTVRTLPAAGNTRVNSTLDGLLGRSVPGGQRIWHAGYFRRCGTHKICH